MKAGSNKTLKKQKFAEEIIKTGNATKAAKKLGHKDPKKAGHRALHDPVIKEAIEQAIMDSKEAAKWNYDKIFKTLEGNISLANMQKDPATVNKTIEIICKIKGMFSPEKTETIVKAAIDTEHIVTFGIDGSTKVK